jgi:hypothetical protein
MFCGGHCSREERDNTINTVDVLWWSLQQGGERETTL